MEKKPPPFKKHLFVCVNKKEDGASCEPLGGSMIHEKLKACALARGLKGIVRVSKSGCMDVCAKGPNVLVFPDNIWYHGVTPEDVDAIAEEILSDESSHPIR